MTNISEMKSLYLILVFLTFSILGFSKEYQVYGPQGGLAMEVTLPDDFDENTDKCPMVILMLKTVVSHAVSFFASQLK